MTHLPSYPVFSGYGGHSPPRQSQGKAAGRHAAPSFGPSFGSLTPETTLKKRESIGSLALRVFCYWPKIALSLPRIFIPGSSKIASEPHLSPVELDTLKKLKTLRFMHAVTTRRDFNRFLKQKRFTALDMDVRYDRESGRLLVSHASLALVRRSKRTTLEERLDEIMKLPPGKAAAVKIDIKHQEAIAPLIRLLKQKLGDGPEWQKRIWILNADVNLGELNSRSRITVEDMKALGREFPEGVMSFGFDNKLRRISPELWDTFLKATACINNKKVASVHCTTDCKSADGVILTTWADHVHRRCRPFLVWHISAERKLRSFLDF